MKIGLEIQNFHQKLKGILKECVNMESICIYLEMVAILI